MIRTMQQRCGLLRWVGSSLLVAGASALLAPAGQAATFTWNSNTGGNWDLTTASGWNTGGGTSYPNATDDVANLVRNITADQVMTINVADAKVGTLTLTDSTTASNNWTVAATGGNALTFAVASGSAALNSTTKDNVISAPVTLLAPLNVSVTGTSLTMSAAISDGASSFGLTKSGALSLTDELILSGNNSYDGPTAINQGILTLSGNNSANTGNITLTGGTNFKSQLNINNANALGTGTLIITSGPTASQPSTLGNTSGSAKTLASNNTQTWDSFITFVGPSDLNLGAGAVTLNSAVTLSTTAGTLTVGGGITDGASSFGILKVGAGTLVLAGANSYDGVTTLQATNSGGALRLAGSNSGTGGTTLAATGATGQTLQLASNSNGGLASGTLTLGGTSGTVTIRSSDAAGSDTLASRSVSNAVVFGVNATIIFDGTGDLHFTNTGSSNLGMGAGTRTLTVNNGVTTFDFNLIFAATGTPGLLKNGPGTLIFNNTTNPHTYAGATTITAGTLLMNGSSAAGSSAYTVQTAGTLGGSGAIGGTVSINSGGTLSPGNSPGTLTTGAETWAGGGRYIWEINDVDSIGGRDLALLTTPIATDAILNITATTGSKFTIEVRSLTLANVLGNVNDFSNANAYTWAIASANSITGFSWDANPSLSNITLDTSGFANTFTGAFSLAAVGGNLNLVYTPAPLIPEPASLALLGVGGLTLGVRKRKLAK